MKLSCLPSELRLNILEYGGINLFVSREDIVNRIKVYNPVFDYNRWKKDISTKKEFIRKTMNSPLMSIYTHMKEWEVTIVIDLESNERIQINSGNIDIGQILGIIRSAGYNIEIKHSNSSNHYIAIMNKCRGFQEGVSIHMDANEA